MKETVEEAAEKYAAECGDGYDDKAFIAGAKWQAKRMYSEEDMISLLDFVNDTLPDLYSRFNSRELLNKWLE